MTATVRIHWGQGIDNQLLWNNVYTWAVEYFGPPGDRFTTLVGVFFMDFIFESEKDALLMSLRWNAPLILDDQNDHAF